MMYLLYLQWLLLKIDGSLVDRRFGTRLASFLRCECLASLALLRAFCVFFQVNEFAAYVDKLRRRPPRCRAARNELYFRRIMQMWPQDVRMRLRLFNEFRMSQARLSSILENPWHNRFLNGLSTKWSNEAWNVYLLDRPQQAPRRIVRIDHASGLCLQLGLEYRPRWYLYQE